MAPQPKVKPLSRITRSIYFLGLFSIFVVGVPVLILLATGYRFENGTELVSTGGIYVGSDRASTDIYINDELVRGTRVFRRGFYAQNLEPGIHRVHVQKEDHHTWVKEIVVVPHRVTEAQAFNLPLEPDVREIPRFTLRDGTPLFELSTTTASSTAALLASPTTRTLPNDEYESVLELFGTTTATSTPETLDILTLIEGEFVATTTTEVSTTTKEWQDIRLFEKEGGLFARWVGEENDIPYYFCAVATSTPPSDAAPDIVALGTPISEVSIDPKIGTTTEVVLSDIVLEQSCRDEIQLNIHGEELASFDFFPDNSDLVVLLLGSGIYVEEIDDRGWQNRQPLYLKEGLDMRIVSGRIYVKDDEYLLEILLEE